MTLTADVFGPRPQPAAEIGDRKRESQATAIVRLALKADVELWHTPTGDSYITIAVDSHQEHHPLGSRATRDYLTRLYYRDSATPRLRESAERDRDAGGGRDALRDGAVRRGPA